MDKKKENQEKVLTSISHLPDQIEQTLNEVSVIDIPHQFFNAKNIVICGMGGSRFPAYVVSECFKPKLKIPIFINDEYLLPGWVSKDTLFVLSSYSGTTEEVLFNAKEANKISELLLGISTGGDLAKLLKDWGKPVYVYNPKFNPSGQPRIAVGYAIGSILSILVKLGFLELSEHEIKNSLEFLRKKAKEFRKQDSLPFQLAKQVYRKMPFYITAEFLRGIGNVMANQTNETAKSVAEFHFIPELNHHLMEGLKNPETFHENAVFVFLVSDFYSERIRKRFVITQEVVRKNKINTVEIQVEGKNKLEQCLYAVLFSSFYTYYLSEIYGEDPTIIPFVDYFKKRLKEDV